MKNSTKEAILFLAEVCTEVFPSQDEIPDNLWCCCCDLSLNKENARAWRDESGDIYYSGPNCGNRASTHEEYKKRFIKKPRKPRGK